MIDIFEYAKNKFNIYKHEFRHYRDHYWFWIPWCIEEKWDDMSDETEYRFLFITIGLKKSMLYMELALELDYSYENTKYYKADIPQNALKSNSTMTRWINKEISNFCGFKVKL